METLTLVPPVEQPCDGRTLDLVERMLKDPGRVDDHLREPALQAALIPRFLAISLAGFTIFGIAATVVRQVAGTWPSWAPEARWGNGTAGALILAYDLGPIATTAVCLPSFYFYGLLAGLKLSMLQVTAHAMKCMATSTIMLMGILPIYMAAALGMAIFGAPQHWMEATIALGLALPFIAGLWGVRSIYVGFMGLCDLMPTDRRSSRQCFLRRLVLAWSACFTAVAPLMIYTLWRHFAG